MPAADKSPPAPRWRPPHAPAASSPGGTASQRLWPAALGWQKPSLILFLLFFFLNQILLVLGIEADLPVVLLLASSALCAVVSVACRLPLQNVLMSAILIVSLTGVVVSVGAVTGVPFGPVYFSPKMGPQLFEAAPWSLLLVWLVVILLGRSVARLMVRPWRKTNYYGYWVMGWTAMLAVHFDLALEPFAVEVRGYWLWQPTRTWLQWYGVPWVNFLGWFITTIAVLCLTLPWLINKQPVKRPMDYHPLLCWLGLHAWLATGNALHGLWGAAAVGVLGCIPAAAFAIRGARW